MPRIALASAALAATSSAALVSMWCVAAQPADASDLNLPPNSHARSERIAAASVDVDTARFLKQRARADEQMEIELLLAQSTPPTAADADGDTILAGFPLSAPETIEEDVAKAHKLEIVRRFALAALDKRIVVYRPNDGRSVAEAVAALKADLRVSSAQASVRYGLPPQASPPAAVGDLPRPADTATVNAKQGSSRPGNKGHAPSSRSKGAHRPPAGQATVAAMPAPRTTRSRQQHGSLVAGKQAALRFPSADEPFVNLGVPNR
jgi:hypothetical protein